MTGEPVEAPADPPPVRLTRAQVREVDRIAIEEYHIPGIVLMENAARGVVDAAMEMMDPAKAGVVIVCGGGNNGGDGYAVARHLHNRGVHVEVIDAAARDLKGDALINSRITDAMGIQRTVWQDAEDLINPHAMDFVIDALFGTGLTRPPEGELTILIDLMNECGLPVLAVDLPSGVDCDTGEPLGNACVRATRTVTFVAEKAGFAHPAARQYTGTITVADIGCPRELIARVSSA
jgi:NAD(P)H-hydrate epimerase